MTGPPASPESGSPPGKHAPQPEVAPSTSDLHPEATLPYLQGQTVPTTRHAMLIAQQSSWAGPYPPPDAAERFEKLAPGAFDRILAMAEKAQAAEISAAERGQEYTRRDMRRGQILGFIVSAGAMLGSLTCLALHQPWVAAIFLSVPVMAVAKAFIDSARSTPRGSKADDSPNGPASRPEPE